MFDNEVQEIAQKKRYLKRYRKNIACINRLNNKLYLLTNRIESIKSPSFSGMPRGGVPVTVAELLSDKIELEKRIERLQLKNKKIKSEILEEIDSLDDPRYCEVLEAYFIDCMTISEIAEKEAYTDRHIYRLYDEAIRLLALNGQ